MKSLHLFTMTETSWLVAKDSHPSNLKIYDAWSVFLLIFPFWSPHERFRDTSQCHHKIRRRDDTLSLAIPLTASSHWPLETLRDIVWSRVMQMSGKSDYNCTRSVGLYRQTANCPLPTSPLLINLWFLHKLLHGWKTIISNVLHSQQWTQKKASLICNQSLEDKDQV